MAMTDQDLSFPICIACNAQYGSLEPPQLCKICEDPRQFVPAQGQSWTTLRELRQSHKNKWEQDSENKNVWSCYTEPKSGIGERAMLIQTPHGNVLWDLIALLDDETMEFINGKGQLKAIVISHPHFYTTYAVWGRSFDCKVYVAADDVSWLSRNAFEHLQLIEGPVGSQTTILPDVTAVKVGGHFPGSLVLHWEKTLFIADAFVHVPSAYSPPPRPKGQTTFAFMWSIPNMIPLHSDKIKSIVNALQRFNFDTTHGVFVNMTVRDKDLKQRLIESAKIQINAQGFVCEVGEGGRLD